MHLLVKASGSKGQLTLCSMQDTLRHSYINFSNSISLFKFNLSPYFLTSCTKAISLDEEGIIMR